MIVFLPYYFGPFRGYVLFFGAFLVANPSDSCTPKRHLMHISSVKMSRVNVAVSSSRTTPLKTQGKALCAPCKNT